MGILKWVGCIAAALVVLSVVIGIVGFVAAVMTIGGALVALCGVIFIIAALLKSLWEEVFS